MQQTVLLGPEAQAAPAPELLSTPGVLAGVLVPIVALVLVVVGRQVLLAQVKLEALVAQAITAALGAAVARMVGVLRLAVRPAPAMVGLVVKVPAVVVRAREEHQLSVQELQMVQPVPVVVVAVSVAAMVAVALVIMLLTAGPEAPIVLGRVLELAAAAVVGVAQTRVSEEMAGPEVITGEAVVAVVGQPALKGVLVPVAQV